jgi:hypothetical protein
MLEEFIKIIVGGEYTNVMLLAYLWFFVVGYVIYGLTETTGRDVKSKRTPNKWSWKFWFKDNWRRYLTTLLCTYILFRFYTEISGHPFGYFDAVSTGLIGDGISATIKKRVRGMTPYEGETFADNGDNKYGGADNNIDLNEGEKQ